MYMDAEERKKELMNQNRVQGGMMQVILSENFFRDILPEELKSASFYSKRKWLIDNGIIGSRMVDGVEVESKPYGIGYRIPTQGLLCQLLLVIQS